MAAPCRPKYQSRHASLRACGDTSVHCQDCSVGRERLAYVGKGDCSQVKIAGGYYGPLFTLSSLFYKRREGFFHVHNLTHHDEAKTSTTQVCICDRSLLLPKHTCMSSFTQTANSHIKHLTVVASRDSPYTLQKVGPNYNVHPVFHSFQQTGVCWMVCVNYSGWTRLCF